MEASKDSVKKDLKEPLLTDIIDNPLAIAM